MTYSVRVSVVFDVDKIINKVYNMHRILYRRKADLNYLTETYLLKFYRARNKIVRSIRCDVANMGMTHESFMALRFIYENPGISQAELADASGKDRNVIGRMIDRLEEMDYVERKRCKQDRRFFCLFVTEKGEQIQAEAWEILMKRQKECIGCLSDEEQKLLMEYLERITSN